jgi:hypothetical protein
MPDELTRPGSMLFSRMPRVAHSTASVRIIASTPALAATECAMPGKPRRVSMVMLTTLPPWSSIQASAMARVRFQVPVRFVATTASKPLPRIISAGDMNCPPPLLTSRSTRPKRSTTRRARASHASRSRMSSSSPYTGRPTSSLRPAAAGPMCSALRLAMTTVAPRRPSSRAVAAPMPVPPPVMRQT